MSVAEFKALLPAVLLVVTGLTILLTDLFVTDEDGRDDPGSSKSHLTFIGLSGTLLAFASLFLDGGLLVSVGSDSVLSGALKLDAFGGFAAALILTGLFFTTLSSGNYLASQKQNLGEFHGLVFLGAAAMIVLCQANNLISLFVAIETLSLSVYVLAGFFRKWKLGSEGAMKYFIMGAFSSGFLVFGMALMYLATGEVSLDAMARRDVEVYLLNVGLLLVTVGFAFKVGAVPFHSWVPDAYQGAPAISAGWMAVAVKTCSFAALIRLMIACKAADVAFAQILAALAVVTMVLGNLAALNQTNVKRMLAYSGIAHTGYLLIPVVLAFQERFDERVGAGALFYLAAYVLMTVGAFTAISFVSKGEVDREELDQYNGLARRQPLVALALTVSLLSLAGIPGTAGFLGKVVIFKDAVDSGAYFYLAMIGVLASLVSVYYYLRPIVAMYFKDQDGEIEVVERAWGLKLTLILTTLGTVGLFFFGKPIQELSLESIRSLTG